MAYGELIKNFESIRDYMREFYVFGFRRRGEIGAKSARSYDNERRRIESWLGGYMSFTWSPSGRARFLSVDGRDILHNPLYQAFRAKSFTDNDIVLHFYLLDLLGEKEWLSFREIVDGLQEEYFDKSERPFLLDESTVRNKLKEYVKIGLFEQKKDGKSIFYRRVNSRVDLPSWADAAAFFSEENPLGVIGSFLLARGNAGEVAAGDDAPGTECFQFRHHYMLYALDCQVLYGLLDAMHDKCTVRLAVSRRRREAARKYDIYPVRIFISTQTGREYVLGYEYVLGKLSFFRLDHVKGVEKGRREENWESHERRFEKFRKNLWGVSAGQERRTEHLEMTVAVHGGEEHIVRRLEREKRNGRVEKLDGEACQNVAWAHGMSKARPYAPKPCDVVELYRYTTNARDTVEMLPWIRTFIGRIVKLECSNPAVAATFENDMRELYDAYQV